MNSLKFTDLSKSILSLFEHDPRNYTTHDCIHLLGGGVARMGMTKQRITGFIGDIDDFRNWVKPKLDAFFSTFDKYYFFTRNERINRRRNYIYEKIVKSKACKRIAFKRKMMVELDLDITSFLKDGEFDGEYTDTEENRRILFLNCIKNYVHRLFLTDVHCHP